MILSLGHNDLDFASLTLDSAENAYPELLLDGYLAIEDVETYKSGKFKDLMSEIEKFAKDKGYRGIVLRAETQDDSRVSQEDLEKIYQKFGFKYLDTEAYEESDVFMVKNIESKRTSKQQTYVQNIPPAEARDIDLQLNTKNAPPLSLNFRINSGEINLIVNPPTEGRTAYIVGVATIKGKISVKTFFTDEIKGEYAFDFVTLEIR